MYKFKSSIPKDTTGRSVIAPKPLPVWQPKKDQEVLVFGATNEFERKFMGKRGIVVRNRGFGYFEIRFEDGQCPKLRSTILRGL